MKSQLFLLFIPLFFSCLSDPGDQPPDGPVFNKTGYRAIYATETDVKKIVVQPARALSDPGKIYVFGKYLFINERGKGVHVFDNSNPKQPDNLSFISIPSNFDMAVKGNWLYVDNAADLLVIDITEPRDPKLTKRISNAIPAVNYPPYIDIYFECVDAKKGVVVGWEKVDMQERPGCFR